MKERDFQSEFGKRNTVRGVFELKLCKSKSMPFNHVAEHQVKALLAADGYEGLYHKLTDQTYGGKMRFTHPKPFDCFRLFDVPAYIVIMFYIPRQKKAVYYIPVTTWVERKSQAGRKSLTESMAAEWANRVESYIVVTQRKGK